MTGCEEASVLCAQTGMTINSSQAAGAPRRLAQGTSASRSRKESASPKSNLVVSCLKAGWQKQHCGAGAAGEGDWLRSYIGLQCAADDNRKAGR